MRILSLEEKPFHVLRYSLGADDGRLTLLPLHRAIVTGLPSGIDVLVAIGDLQGFALPKEPGATPRLLAEALAGEIESLRAGGVLPPRERTAAILAGDFYPHADEGDVTDVWHRLADACGWVAGVAGNHDLFGAHASKQGAQEHLNRANVHLLDGDIVDVDGLTIGGISGIVGDRGGAWARPEREFTEVVGRLAHRRPDLLVTHDGPNVAGTPLAGWPAVRRALEAAPPTLLIRGHDPWPTPLAVLANGSQVLNVEGRVALLTADRGE